MPDKETPVMIVGGGPAGLAASLTLSQLGVPSLLVSKYEHTLAHPRAVGIMQRTVELMRSWGVADEVARRGVAPEFCKRMIWTTTLSGEELGPRRRSSPITSRPSRRARSPGCDVRRTSPNRCSARQPRRTM